MSLIPILCDLIYPACQQMRVGRENGASDLFTVLSFAGSHKGITVSPEMAAVEEGLVEETVAPTQGEAVADLMEYPIR